MPVVAVGKLAVVSTFTVVFGLGTFVFPVINPVWYFDTVGDLARMPILPAGNQMYDSD